MAAGLYAYVTMCGVLDLPVSPFALVRVDTHLLMLTSIPHGCVVLFHSSQLNSAVIELQKGMKKNKS